MNGARVGDGEILTSLKSIYLTSLCVSVFPLYKPVIQAELALPVYSCNHSICCSFFVRWTFFHLSQSLNMTWRVKVQIKVMNPLFYINSKVFISLTSTYVFDCAIVSRCLFCVNCQCTVGCEPCQYVSLVKIKLWLNSVSCLYLSVSLFFFLPGVCDLRMTYCKIAI